MFSYDDVIEWLFAKNRDAGIRLGLERMDAAAQILSSPHTQLRCVHVAGTNGKGSICTKIAKAYELSGYRVGLYTSPHVSSFRERMQINGAYIPCDTVIRLASLVKEKCSPELSFFEATTQMAFLWFVEKSVDIAIIETGLGGRLDATNICRPDLSIISSISFDHTQYLGSTLEAIAKEKAGIIKHAVPVLIGPRVPRLPVQKSAVENSAELFQVEGVYEDYDEENSIVARKALEVLSKKWLFKNVIEEAIKQRPVCRFQEIPLGIIEKSGVNVRIVLDVAHNPDGIAHLLMKAKRQFQVDKFVFLLGVSSDKDVQGMAKILQPSVKAIVCTEAPSPRALPAKELEKVVMAPCVVVEPVLKIAFAKAVDIAAKYKVPLLVTGTFFLMSSVRQLLGFQDFSDIMTLTEQKEAICPR